MCDIRLSSLISPAYYDIARDVFNHGHTHYDISGGRGSLKSSTISLLVPLLIVKNPGTHALVLRKIGNTIRDSVYAQYLWAIDMLGLTKYWASKVSPLELTYKPTGQKILFRGADDPMKIKSIKVPFGYIAITHFEEKDQFSGRQEIRTILQSTMRGGSKFWNFESYNPPISRDNWANIDSLEQRIDRICLKTSYLQAPANWLGEQFIIEAEHLKETNERAYRHEYLGEPTGTGGNVFDNIVSREVNDEEIKTFDRIYNGIDWGYYPDPWAFARMQYDPAQRRLIIFDELFAQKKGNRETANLLIEHGISYNDRITADSAEPKSISDYKSFGLDCRGAIKGAGSVDYSMKWLQSLNEIVIDNKRCPHTYQEFISYEYERNKDGEIISGYPDGNDHFISATRYALEQVWRRRGQ